MEVTLHFSPSHFVEQSTFVTAKVQMRVVGETLSKDVLAV